MGVMATPLPTDIDLPRLKTGAERKRDEAFWWDLLEHSYWAVLRSGDFTHTGPEERPGVGHRLVCSPFVLHLMQKDERWHTRVGGPLGNHVPGSVRLMGMFEPVSYMPSVEWSDAPAYDMRFELFYLRVERVNGRFAYVDWSGNPEDLR